MVQDCPPRLQYVPKELVDDHTQLFLPMLNDTDRNDFFWHALKACDLEGKMVLDIGAGSGILSLMAARLGARRVVAVEECGDLVRIARRNVAANGYEAVVEIRHGLAADLQLNERADVLVTETLGTWMTCEGIIQYCEDARRRLLKDGAQVVPQCGTQYAVLVESEELERLFSFRRSYRGIDLSAVMELQDTASVLWSKRIGLRPAEMVYRELCEPFPVLTADFNSTLFSALPSCSTSRVCTTEGTVHAVLDFWVVEDSQGRQLSTDPRARRCEPWAYARDIAWGNGLQLVGEEREAGVDADDVRWATFEGCDVASAGGGASVEDGEVSMDAGNLRLCRGMCLFYGYTGFTVVGDRAFFRRAPRTELLSGAGRAVAPGRTLHVARADFGAPAEVEDGTEPGLVGPEPFRVADGEALEVVTAFQAEHRGAHHSILRV